MVYVDDLCKLARAGNLLACWSHLTADSTEELHVFAARLGLRREWFQPASVYPDNEVTRARGIVGLTRKGARDHYDLTDPRRRRAIAMGAISVRRGHEPWRNFPTGKQNA